MRAVVLYLCNIRGNECARATVGTIVVAWPAVVLVRQGVALRCHLRQPLTRLVSIPARDDERLFMHVNDHLHACKQLQHSALAFVHKPLERAHR